MTDAYIVDGVRTAVGNIGGALSEVRADDLAAHVIARADAPTSDARSGARSRDVILGCANQAGDDNRNVARMALLLAGLPGDGARRDGESAVRVGHERGRERGARRASSATATSTSPAASRA